MQPCGMSDAEFFSNLSSLLGTPELGEEEQRAVLELTRLVAHGSERRFAPLTAYAVALTMDADSSTEDRTARVAEVMSALEATMDADAESADAS